MESCAVSWKVAIKKPNKRVIDVGSLIKVWLCPAKYHDYGTKDTIYTVERVGQPYLRILLSLILLLQLENSLTSIPNGSQ